MEKLEKVLYMYEWPKTLGLYITKLFQLEQALQVSEQDVKDASAGILRDLKRFQLEKEEDLKRYMVCFRLVR